MRGSHKIAVRRRAVVRALAAGAALLVLLSAAGQTTKYLTGHDTVYGLIALFDVDEERNVPTFFSASLLLAAAVLLWIITSAKRKARDPYALQWTVLAVLFMCMAVDEAAGVHELLIRPTKELLGGRASGIFYFAWVVPGLAATALIGLFFIKFLRHLPLRTGRVFALAAVLYVGGALGVELIGGWYVEQHGYENPTYSLIATIEESLEMSGAIVFLHGVMAYIEEHHGEITFRFERAQGRGRFNDGRLPSGKAQARAEETAAPWPGQQA